MIAGLILALKCFIAIAAGIGLGAVAFSDQDTVKTVFGKERTWQREYYQHQARSMDHVH